MLQHISGCHVLPRLRRGPNHGHVGGRSRPRGRLDRGGGDEGVSRVALIFPDAKGDDTSPCVADGNDEAGVGDEPALDGMNAGNLPRLITELVEQRPRDRVPAPFGEGTVLREFDERL